MQLPVDQFFTFFTGIYCDYDGAEGDQCFDLANVYSRWIGGPHFTGATADLIYQQPGDFYLQVPNSPTNFPQKGDLVIWRRPHVGIATGNNTNAQQFEVLEQNDPTNSNCHLKTYSYDGVIGWLQPKQLPDSVTPELQQMTDELRTARDNNWNLYQAEITKNADLSTQLQGGQQQVTDLEGQVNAWKAKYDADEKHIIELNGEIESMATTIAQIKAESKDYAVQSLDAQHETAQVKQELQQVQQQHVTHTQWIIGLLTSIFWPKK